MAYSNNTYSINAYCLNPQCSDPHNPKNNKTCNSCGAPLLLKGRYQAIKAIGQGGFGRTFLGIDRHLPNQAHCVIKQLYLQQASAPVLKKAKQLFEQEAIRLFELGTHPQIPTLLAYFEENGQLYLVQELIQGKTLSPRTWFQETEKEKKIWHLLANLLPVLKFIHDRNIIHRDIKPDNIMQRSSDGQYILIDFGVARILSKTAIMGGATIIGTPGFMAPEQMRGKVLPASDLYSLGVTCLNLLTGQPPEQMFDVIEERWHWRKFLPQGTTISSPLANILNSLIQSSLKKRAQSAEIILREIAILFPSQKRPSSASSPTSSTSAPPTTPLSIKSTQEPTQALQLSKPPAGKLLTRQATASGDIQIEALKEKLASPEEEEELDISIDYTQLNTLLKRKRWKQADQETWNLLCILAGKREGAYLFETDLKKLPCKHLKTLDKLWYKWSTGHFGFRVQSQIYQEVGGQYHLFCQEVGWEVANSSRHSYLQFNLRAPRGHLPSRRWAGGPPSAFWKHARILVDRLEECNLK